jgi:hypothetical protein
MSNFNEDFKNFNPNTSFIHAQVANKANLERLEIDPMSDDTIFGSKFVFCGAHRRAHKVGWCGVRISQKRPLDAENKTEAQVEIEALGFAD